MARRSRMTGSTAIRKLMKKAPQEISDELFDSIVDGGKVILREQQKLVRRQSFRTGKLHDALQMTKQRKSLTVKVGIVSKAARKKAPHAHLVEKGTGIRRLIKKEGDTGFMPRRSFIKQSLLNKSDDVIKMNAKAVDKALIKLGRGG